MCGILTEQYDFEKKRIDKPHFVQKCTHPLYVCLFFFFFFSNIFIQGGPFSYTLFYHGALLKHDIIKTHTHVMYH